MPQTSDTSPDDTATVTITIRITANVSEWAATMHGVEPTRYAVGVAVADYYRSHIVAADLSVPTESEITISAPG
jgi:hypothetical protein